MSGLYIFAAVSFIALFGTFFKLFYTGRFEKLSLVLYLFMGWLVIVDIKTVFEVIEFNGFLLLVLGGVSYSIGTIFYSLDKKYAHTVWHLFVLAGSTLHFFFILFYII
jgi:hemolysin III